MMGQSETTHKLCNYAEPKPFSRAHWQLFFVPRKCPKAAPGDFLLTLDSTIVGR
jgi:hypothetical protein